MFSFSEIPPFSVSDVLLHVTEYLGVQDVGRFARVCRGSRDWVNDQPVVWQYASHQDKIPVVAGKDRDLKEDLRCILPLVSSVHGLLGRIVGPVAPISEKMFRKFTSDDPDRFGEGCFKNNFALLVNPSSIARRVDKETPLALENGKLVEVDPSKVEEKTIVIEATLPNLLMLFKYPLKGKERLPVYAIGEKVMKALFEQCTFFPEEVGVSFMRKNIIEDSRDKDFVPQQALVEQKAPGEGCRVMSLRERLLFDGERILKTGTCPDVRKPMWTSARGTETVTIDGNGYQLDVGGFAPRDGVLFSCGYPGPDCIGIVPGGPAEVPRP